MSKNTTVEKKTITLSQAIWRIIKKYPGLTIDEMQKLHSSHEKKAWQERLNVLLELQLIRRERPRRQFPYRYFPCQ